MITNDQQDILGPANANTTVLPRALMPPGKKGPTGKEVDAFMAACLDGRLDEVANFVAAGFDINVQHRKALPYFQGFEDRRLTGLMYAAIQGRTEVARYLLSQGADVRLESKLRFTAMRFAAELGRTEMAVDLLSHGANPNEVGVLHQTIYNGHLETAKVLIEHGADPTYRIKHGNPLEAAARAGSVELVRKLLKKGANPNPSVNQPIVAAAAKGHDHIVRVLLSAGAVVNSIDVWGMTPLMWAARHGHGSTVKLLIANKADIDAISGNLSYGKLTAMGFAEKENHPEIVRMLKSSGARSNVEPQKSYKLRWRRGGEWVT